MKSGFQLIFYMLAKQLMRAALLAEVLMSNGCDKLSTAIVPIREKEQKASCLVKKGSMIKVPS